MICIEAMRGINFTIEQHAIRNSSEAVTAVSLRRQ